MGHHFRSFVIESGGDVRKPGVSTEQRCLCLGLFSYVTTVTSLSSLKRRESSQDDISYQAISYCLSPKTLKCTLALHTDGVSKAARRITPWNQARLLKSRLGLP
ncbi:hypothetical protein CIRG_00497 [Coccidioides immitis RMSCC 2394]|uniref:Uncharacterized protein n=1 Tax=Coccidioides immitis RMSCC 2394 TaxID=404692 RepID=A0A0J6XY58_COCIT|nr:hypothetical protein CIRG_00497 [Coccidioides immitis RMSCC 2394]